MVMMTGSLAVRGTVVWLTPQQGGRVSGPPEPDYDYDYTATAYLPPRTPEDGQAGIAVSRFAPGAWRTPAEGILVPPKGHRAQQVIPGCIVIITEGVRPVGLFTVEEVHALAADGTQVPATTPAPASAPALDEVTGAPEIPPYRHSTAAARWASQHSSDSTPAEPLNV
ncbi:hypothetical protein [Kribbella sp. NPDC004875]|uniref:hypothetical protein n=1 Tax=Kribbella sp. NPDC004875 TaxID=3364107 RepID=UPI00369ECF60